MPSNPSLGYYWQWHFCNLYPLTLHTASDHDNPSLSSRSRAARLGRQHSIGFEARLSICAACASIPGKRRLALPRPKRHARGQHARLNSTQVNLHPQHTEPRNLRWVPRFSNVVLDRPKTPRSHHISTLFPFPFPPPPNPVLPPLLSSVPHSSSSSSDRRHLRPQCLQNSRRICRISWRS